MGLNPEIKENLKIFCNVLLQETASPLERKTELLRKEKGDQAKREEHFCKFSFLMIFPGFAETSPPILNVKCSL